MGFPVCSDPPEASQDCCSYHTMQREDSRIRNSGGVHENPALSRCLNLVSNRDRRIRSELLSLLQIFKID